MQTPDIRVIQLPRLLRGPRWRLEAARSYAAHQLIWVTRGQGKIFLDGRMAGFVANTAIFVPAGGMHAFAPGAQVFGMAVFIDAGLPIAMPERAHILKIGDTRRQADISAILDGLQLEIDSGAPGRDRAMLARATLLSVWLERRIAAEQPPARVNGSRTQLLARRYAALVEENFTSDWGVAHYAAALGVTPTHLTRICRESAGRTAHEILAERKISEARRLLADTDLPVKEIAAGLGFGSAPYFTRAFQARAGRSPRAFRRNPGAGPRVSA